jgi:hypothetical protein
VVKVRYVLIALLLVAVSIGVGLRLFQSEEKRVKKQFDLLSEGVSKGGDENAIVMARQMQKLGTLFDEKCELKFPADSFSGIYTPEEISSYAARGRARFSKLSLEFIDFDVTFPEKGVAKVNLTAKLTGRTRAGEQVRETRELECLLKKIERKWLFNDIEVVEVLKK